ncbi:MAG TPA: hypothetical protein VGX23_14420 [Actinocrinis sp.]|nr:hypothetical protein [Actinocrinis sp.]
MLRREGDGVRWWIERQALLGKAVPPPSLVAAWSTLSTPTGAVESAEAVIARIEADPAAARWRPGRSRVNGYWNGEHGAGRWDQASQVRILGRVREPDGDGLDLSWHLPDPGRPPEYYWASTLRLSGHAPGRAAGDRAAGAAVDASGAGHWRWTLEAAAGRFRGPDLDLAADLFTAVLHTVAERRETSWGAVLHDHVARNRPLPCEQYLGFEINEPEAGRVARGYYWANLLTEGHLAGLGGSADVRRRCGRAGLAAEPVAGRDALIVRSARPLSQLDDDTLRTLRDVLRPVLATRPYTYYQGPPIRVLKEPGAASRRIPPEIQNPWFEDDGPMNGLGAGYRLVPDE